MGRGDGKNMEDPPQSSLHPSPLEPVENESHESLKESDINDESDTVNNAPTPSSDRSSSAGINQ